MYKLTYQQLLSDLHQAYYDASKHKHTKSYVMRFARNLESNLIALCNELYERRYQPQPSTCFIITDPKKREVFAADFRDRIVHHLYYNYTHALYERTFRIVISAESRVRMRSKLQSLAEWVKLNREVLPSHIIKERLRASLNSFCGVLAHGRNYHNRLLLIACYAAFRQYGRFDNEVRHFVA